MTSAVTSDIPALTSWLYSWGLLKTLSAHELFMATEEMQCGIDIYISLNMKFLGFFFNIYDINHL